METDFDILVVGGGLAGMTAAIYAARANFRVLVLEKTICGGLANYTYVVENFPSYPSVNGMELMEKVKGHVEGLGVRIEEISEVIDLSLEPEVKTIVTAEGEFTAEAVILATGRVPRPLPVETDWDEHIHYCAVCDGMPYKGKDVIVVGGGNSGFDESLYLVSLGVNSVLIVEALDSCLADQTTQEKALSSKKIRVQTSTSIKAISQEGAKGNVLLENSRTGRTEQLLVDGVFVFIGQTPNTSMFKDALTLDRQGYLVATSDMHTNIPGVFAAGDVVAKKYRQLTTAAADGTIAAMEAGEYLRAQKAEAG